MYSFNPAHELSTIKQAYARAEALLRLPSFYIYRPSTEFSKWSIADHLVHLARTNLEISAAVEQLIAGNGIDGRPTKLGAFLLLWGRIPRRRAQATKSIHPPQNLGRRSAREIWDESATCIENLNKRCDEIRAAQPRFKHQIFGALTAQQWVRFASIHTNHHLRIAEDVLLIRSGGH